MRETERNDSFLCEKEGVDHWAAVWRCCRVEIEGENSCQRVKIDLGGKQSRIGNGFSFDGSFNSQKCKWVQLRWVLSIHGRKQGRNAHVFSMMGPFNSWKETVQEMQMGSARWVLSIHGRKQSRNANGFS